MHESRSARPQTPLKQTQRVRGRFRRGRPIREEERRREGKKSERESERVGPVSVFLAAG